MFTRGIRCATRSRMAQPADLVERTRQFALAIRAFCQDLPNTDEAREAARQLRRAANSMRSNYRAARRGRSRAEFEAKLGVVFEESDECVDWLEYFRDANIQADRSLIQEARELATIFAAARRTTRRNSEKLRSGKGEK